MFPVQAFRFAACLPLVLTFACARGGIHRPLAEPNQLPADGGPQRIEENRYASAAIVYSLLNGNGEQSEALVSGVVVGERTVLSVAVDFPDGLQATGVAVVLTQPDGSVKKIAADLAATGPQFGLALLTVEESLPTPVVIRDDAAPKRGDVLYTIDAQDVNGQYIPGQVHVGSVAHIDAPDSPVRFMVAETAAFARGSRGCGVFNRDGELIGLTVMTLFGGDEPTTPRGLAVSAPAVVQFLRANGVAFVEAE